MLTRNNKDEDATTKQILLFLSYVKDANVRTFDICKSRAKVSFVKGYSYLSATNGS